MGVPFARRGKRADEMLEVMRKLWTGEVVEHHGEYFDVPPLEMLPAPTEPVPVHVGGTSEAALRRAARHDGWVSDLHTIEELAAIRQQIERYREEYDRTHVPFSLFGSASDAWDLDGYRRVARGRRHPPRHDALVLLRRGRRRPRRQGRGHRAVRRRRHRQVVTAPVGSGGGSHPVRDVGGRRQRAARAGARRTGCRTRGHEVRAMGTASLADRFAAGGLPYVARDVVREWDQTALADDVRAEATADVVVADYMLPAALCGAAEASTVRPSPSSTPCTPPTSTATAGSSRCRWRPRSRACGQCGRSSAWRRSRASAGCSTARPPCWSPVRSPSTCPGPRRRQRAVRRSRCWRTPGPMPDGARPASTTVARCVVVEPRHDADGRGPGAPAPRCPRSAMRRRAWSPPSATTSIAADLARARQRPRERHVRHAALLPWASAFVSHGGLGSVLAGAGPRAPAGVRAPRPRTARQRRRRRAGRRGLQRSIPTSSRRRLPRRGRRPCWPTWRCGRARRRMAMAIDAQRAAGDAELEIERLLDLP